MNILKKFLSEIKALLKDDLPHNLCEPKHKTAQDMKEYWDKRWAEHKSQDTHAIRKK